MIKMQGTPCIFYNFAINCKNRLYSLINSWKMKYIIQFTIIIAISLIGELLNIIIPLPIPASIYGMVILFTALTTGIIKLSAVKETGKFLIYIMPLMFLPPTVGLIGAWDTMQSFLVAIVVISLVSTIIVLAVSGYVTQWIIEFKERRSKR